MCWQLGEAPVAVSAVSEGRSQKKGTLVSEGAKERKGTTKPVPTEGRAQGCYTFSELSAFSLWGKFRMDSSSQGILYSTGAQLVAAVHKGNSKATCSPSRGRLLRQKSIGGWKCVSRRPSGLKET